MYFSGAYSQTNLQLTKISKTNYHIVIPGLLEPLGVWVHEVVAHFSQLILYTLVI